MKYNILQHVPGLRGQLILEQGKDADGKPAMVPATYASVLSMLVNTPEQDPKKARELGKILDAVDDAAYARGAISSGLLELSPEQVVYVKENALRAGISPLAYSRLADFLDNPGTERDGIEGTGGESPAGIFEKVGAGGTA